MSEITRGSGRRNAKLAALPIGMAGRAAAGLGKRIAGKDKDAVNQELMEKAAEQLFAVLGELKGGAMKVGQALSIMEAAIPEEFGEPFREALTKLQAEAPPLPAARCTGSSTNSSAPSGVGGSGSSPTPRPQRPASVRSTRRSGPTAARWRSRSSTRAPTML